MSTDHSNIELRRLNRLSTNRPRDSQVISFSPISSNDSPTSVINPLSLGIAPEAGHSRTHIPSLTDTDFKLQPLDLHDDDDTKSQFPTDRVHDLAKQFRRQSRRDSVHVHADGRRIDNPLDPKEGGPYDPLSPKFNARRWIEAIVRQNRTPNRSAGISYRNLCAFGSGSDADVQKNVANVGWLTALSLFGAPPKRVDILRSMDGLVKSGEMLIVLGPPGSGCSTFLKTIAGETHGYQVDPNSHINYQGIMPQQMHHDFRGEVIYNAEVDVHFPQMTVGDTLYFAAQARAPRLAPGGISRHLYATMMRDVIMAIFGISHTINTNVGNDFIRGVSGGERKRITIAEAALAGAPLQCWDNSTRGLDSANAVEFIKTLRMSAEVIGTTSCVAIYQAPQAAYDLFDKVTVLMEGRQIYFGPCDRAKAFFVTRGFYCPDRQTTADFLTSLTSNLERRVQPGWEGRTPTTADQFERMWKESAEYRFLLREIDEYNAQYPLGGESLEKFQESRRAQQSARQRPTSPYTLSYIEQVNLCLWRGFQRLRGNPEITITALLGNIITALVVGSVFYNLKHNTASFFSRGALLFFCLLTAAFGSALEMLTLYAQRPIVEKHTRYAFYRPSAEAFASMLTDIPNKIANAIVITLTYYFLTNLRREPSAYFFFLLISFSLTLTMSMFFRFVASASRTLSQALAPAAVMILAFIIYSGFVIPIHEMHGWARWINYVDPIGYAFESLMVNEFDGQQFPCSSFVPSGPSYPNATGTNHVCTTVGSVAGSSFVSGTAFIVESYRYLPEHRWRNLGILLAMGVFLMVVYLLAAEYITAAKSKGEVLLFQSSTLKKGKKRVDAERGPDMNHGSGNDVSAIAKQTAIFQWEDVVYDIKIKGEPRRILDHVDGWVKPGTLTALMGVSGAGKTTLLDVLAARVTVGVVTGKMLVDGKQRDTSFQRKTGYVQQQDLHLSTSTVREALTFSALLRQPATVSREEKLAYVDEVIALLEMEAYADAVVGVPGEGLNVEQRKRLTIGVELAAKPDLLLFLDEPTSGLDSQTSWSICDLLAKLTAHGQAILCTIHQPSAVLFQRFDRLLFLAKGGRTIYFGEVGDGAQVLRQYFERNGAHPCPEGSNPAEWMLEVIGAAPGSHTSVDWHQTWKDSPERGEVKRELRRLEERGARIPAAESDTAAYREFAAPFGEQFRQVMTRVWLQYWRTPSYIYAKFALIISSGIFVGLSFLNARKSLQGLQDQMFGIFMLMTIFGNLTQQIMPHFAVQRSLYEARERPSKAYSWQVFMLSNVLVEIPWGLMCSVILFVTIYYPIGVFRNAEPTHDSVGRGALFFLFVMQFLLFTSTFAHMMIAGMDSVETAGNMGNILFSLSLIFCGALAGPNVLPKFWIFMYRVSPFTYFVEGMLVTALANTNVVCADAELLRFNPPSGQTCGDYMSTFISQAGGYLIDSAATDNCSFCNVADTNVFLAGVSTSFSHRWRDFAIIWVYIIFNTAAALGLYWLLRVPKKRKET
ncbi:ATP binding cassette transporter [Roridomyces roridus]|uniref:ATP binding cassette transporter n=1 Tax=Roridomyces roridus TaxID=1738132 RepID=A0AAD7BI20_9AGAR|nr:ATP binding cassette transporter [Roridomyces roridus]